MNIAVTGSVGSGKSAVATMLANLLPASSLDTDAVCRRQLQPGQAGLLALRKRWPQRFFTAEGELDRVALREAVFSDADIRRSLEDILHPLARQEVRTRLQADVGSGTHLLVEIPLLFEVGWQDEFDRVVAVYAPVSVCVRRTSARDGVSPRQAEAILGAQMSPEEKAHRADFVVDNSGLWTATAAQVCCLARQLQRLGME